VAESFLIGPDGVVVVKLLGDTQLQQLLANASGARPMTSAVPGRRALVSLWGIAALTFGSLLAVAEAADGPLDDPDPAHQRPGFLDAFGLPEPASRIDPRLPTAGRRAVVFFERRDRLAGLCAALDDSDLVERADIAVVVAADSAPDVVCASATVVLDPSGEIARAYELRRPAGGGPPVGYAIVDRGGQIRYLTIDPSAPDELYEVRTILDATP